MDARSTEKTMEANNVQLVTRHSHSWRPSTLDVEAQAEVQNATQLQESQGQKLTPEAGPPMQDILQPPTPEQPVEGLAEVQPETSVSVPSADTAVSAPLLHQESVRSHVDVSSPSARISEAKGRDLSSVWAVVTALLVVAILLWLTVSAGRQVESLGRITTRYAKAHLAVGHPEAMCIPGWRDDAAMSTNVQFSCYNPGDVTGGCWYGDEDLTHWVPRNPQSNGWPYPLLANTQASDVILALHCCGAVEYFYTPDNISTWASQATNDELSNAHLGSQRLDNETSDQNAACLTLARLKYCNGIMSTATAIFENPYNDTIRCETAKAELHNFTLSHAHDNDSLTRFVNATFGGKSPSISYTFFTNQSVSEAKGASKSCYTTPAAASFEAFKELHIVEGVLKIQTEKDQVVWLGISQTPETARCLGTSSDTYEFWARNIGCRADVSDFTLGAGQAVWLMPTSFTQIECSEGIDLSYSLVYSGFQAAAQQDFSHQFLHVWVHSNNDLFAIYTAILGALFGAVTILVASIIVAIAQRVMSKFAYCDASRAERNDRVTP